MNTTDNRCTVCLQEGHKAHNCPRAKHLPRIAIGLSLLAASAFAHADSWSTPDKPKHVAASMVTGAAVRLAFPSLTDTEAVAVAMIPGLAKELYDANRRGGTGWSNRDMLANLAGAYVGVKLAGWAISKQGDTVKVSYSTNF